MYKFTEVTKLSLELFPIPDMIYDSGDTTFHDMKTEKFYFNHRVMIMVISENADDIIRGLNRTGPLFTKKTPSYQYSDSHYKPEMVVRPS